ncbi:MAG: ABC-2 transporter permease [Acidobacteria bacterium]|nr:ABC-2 transporter permease [Acidobacteriota bacterium]
MNHAMVKHLVLKDWYFQRGPIAAYTAAALLGLGIVLLDTAWSFFAGTVVIITFTITIGIHLAIVTVVQERTEQTLPFIMSLPISPREYTAAKIVANLSIFLVPWLLVTGGATLILNTEGARSGAVTPFATIVMTYILASYILVLTTAVITESQGWTLCVMGVTNLFLQFFLYWVSHIPSIERGMKGHGAVWDAMAISLLATELALSVLLIGLAFLFQARKRDFM